MRYRGPIAVVLVAAAYVLCVAWPRAQANAGLPNPDTYTSYVPNALYTLEAWDRGSGLLWNRLQNCGQPFFAVILSAVAYPLHLLWWMVDVDTAMLLLLFVHLAIGGLGTYALTRELGVERWSALCAAITFELSTTALFLGYWSPINLAVYAWMPVALALCERLLRRPSRTAAAGLAVAVALQLLAGYPQVAVFTWQVIGLRLLWEVVTARGRARWARVPWVVGALLLGASLAAVQLLPSFEIVAASVRNRPLALAETAALFRNVTFRDYRANGGILYLGLVPIAVAGAAWVHPPHRRLASFFAAVAVLYGVLAFENPLSTLYRALPLGSTFRGPERFLWVTAVCVGILAGLGADAFVRASTRDTGSWARLVLPAWLLLAFVYALATPATLAAVGGVGVALALLALPSAGYGRWGLACGLPVLLAGQLLATPQIFSYRRDSRELFAASDVFAAVRARLTPQDRMYQVAMPAAAKPGGDAITINSVIKKSGMLFGIPSIVDYEPQISARYAGFLVRMFYGRPMRSLNDVYSDVRWVPGVEPLFNLTAARFVVIDEGQMERLHWPSGDRLTLVWQGGGHRVYENRAALARARYVPEMESVADPAALLERLASAADDPRRTVLVEGPPQRRGSAGGTGTAEIEADESEQLRIRVRATAPGFLVLADQDYPGWEATVNGEQAPILRANYAFRAVEVPRGDTLVEFRYRPRSVVIGAAITVLAALATLALARRR